MMHHFFQPTSLIKKILLVLLCTFLAYTFGALRTTQFGPTVKLFLIQVVIAFIAYSIAYGILFHHWHSKKKIIAVLITTLCLILFIEIFAAAQETVARYSDPQCQSGKAIERWWPYQNHAIACDPSSNTWVGTD
jgi:hypothetical protein